MTQTTRCLLLCAVFVLAACSSGQQPARTGSTSTPVSKPVKQASLPARSLPGRLLYVRDKQIWIHAGTTVRALPITGETRDPAWSGDGRRIAFIRRDESFSDLYIFDAQTGQATAVTSNGSQLQKRTKDYVLSLIWAAKPTWSPDGQEIVFLSQRRPPTGEDDPNNPVYEFPLSLYRYKINLIGTREPRNSDLLPIEPGDSDMLSPAWSPDGRYLAYVKSPRDTKPRRIMLYDFETEQATEYPGIPEGAYDPAWSPDGRMLAFAVGQDVTTDIWTIEGVAGGAPQRLTSTGRARTPAWAPDGSAIAFVNVADDSSDLYTIPLKQDNGRLTGGDPVRITEGEQVDATAGLSWSR